MSYTDKQSEVNKLLGEKEHLKQEEVALRKVIEAVKKQVSALQVEQLEIKNRVPLSRVSPSFFLGQPVHPDPDLLKVCASLWFYEKFWGVF